MEGGFSQIQSHIGSISCYIMPLVINNLKGGYTDTHINILQTRSIPRNQARAVVSTSLV